MKRYAWLTWSLIALLPLAHCLGQEDTSQEVFSEPAATAEAYVKAALDGRIDDAVALAEPDTSPARRQSIEELPDVLGKKIPAMVTVYSSERGRAALVLTAKIHFDPQPGGQDKGSLLFTLVRVGDTWLVKDVDIESKEGLADEYAAFRNRYGDAVAAEMEQLSPPQPPGPTVPSDQEFVSTSDIPDSVWDAPLPMFTDPQTVAVYYLAAVQRDNHEHVATLTGSMSKRYATQRFMADFRQDVEVASLRIETVAAVNNQAWVVSEPVKLKEEDPKLGDDPRVVLALRGGGESERQYWLITDVDIVSTARAKKVVETLSTQVNLSKAPYRIRIGDQLYFGSKDDPAWDRTFTVEPDGTVTLQSLGRVWASGLTARELHDRVEEGLSSYYEGSITMPPITVTPAKVNTDVATTDAAPSAAAASSPRAVAEAYIAAAREGRVDDALALVKPGGGNAGRHAIEMIGKNLGGKPPVLENVLVSQQAGEAAALFLVHFTAAEALAEFTAVELPPDLPCRLLLLLSRVEDAWCVRGMEIGDKSAADELRSFQANRRDAVFDWIAERKPHWDVDRSPTHPSAYAPPPPQYQPYDIQSRPPSVAPSALSGYAPPRPYRFHEGDEIHIECSADPQLDRKLIVLPDGTITLRDLGQVKAAGLTVAELRDQLEEAYKEYYHSPGITVTPTKVETATAGAVAGGMPPSSPVGTAPGMMPGEPTSRFMEHGDVMVSWSEQGDAVWGYGKSLGRWTKQEIQPAAKEGLSVTCSGKIAFFQVGRCFYGYSGRTGKWDKLTLPEEPKHAPASVHDDTIVLNVEDNIYTFADATSRWSSRDGSIVDPPETRPDDFARSVPEFARLRASYDQAERQLAYILSKREDTPDDSRSSGVFPALKHDVTVAVQHTFEARQGLQRAELAAFRQRLDAIEKQIDDRDRMQAEIVERRVEELLNPNLKWDPPADEAEAHDSAEMSGANERMPDFPPIVSRQYQEARDSAETAEADQPMPAVPPVDSLPIEIDAHFCPTRDSPTQTVVATAGESVFLVLDVTSREERSLTGLTVSIQLDESLKPQTATEGYVREGNQLTWQNQSVEANQVGHYAVEFLFPKGMPSVMCRATVTDAGGHEHSRQVTLLIDPGKTPLPTEGDEATDIEKLPEELGPNRQDPGEEKEE